VASPDTDRFTRLRCEECQVWSDELAQGWRALIIYHEVDGVKTDDPERVLTYCPDCAHREFDPDGYP